MPKTLTDEERKGAIELVATRLGTVKLQPWFEGFDMIAQLTFIFGQGITGTEKVEIHNVSLHSPLSPLCLLSSPLSTYSPGLFNVLRSLKELGKGLRLPLPVRSQSNLTRYLS